MPHEGPIIDVVVTVIMRLSEAVCDEPGNQLSDAMSPVCNKQYDSIAIITVI